MGGECCFIPLPYLAFIRSLVETYLSRFAARCSARALHKPGRLAFSVETARGVFLFEYFLTPLSFLRILCVPEVSVSLIRPAGSHRADGLGFITGAFVDYKKSQLFKNVGKYYKNLYNNIEHGTELYP